MHGREEEGISKRCVFPNIADVDRHRKDSEYDLLHRGK